MAILGKSLGRKQDQAEFDNSKDCRNINLNNFYYTCFTNLDTMYFKIPKKHVF